MPNLLTRILETINTALLGNPQLINDLRRTASEENPRRSLALSRLVDQLYAMLTARDEAGNTYTFLHDLYAEDDGALFAILSRDGKLYRVPLFVAGDSLAMGQEMQVTEQFAPIATRSLTVKRMANGRYRWIAIAGTAILNRSGELDSRELFENFVRRAEATGRYPRPDFYHLREAAPLGPPADFVCADGVTYIATGLFDDPADNPLAGYAIRALEKEPGYWGTSIEFRPLRRELVDVYDGVSIPVYVDGENEWISMLPEHEASHLMTSLVARQKENIMNQRVKDALLRLLEEDEDLVAVIEAKADGISRTVETEGLISREAPDEPKADEDAPKDTGEGDGSEPTRQEVTDGTADEPGGQGQAPAEVVGGTPIQAQEVELDEEAIHTIAAAAIQNPLFAGLLQPIQEALVQVQEALASLSPEMEALASRNAELEHRLASLERTDEDKKRAYLDDLPSGRRPLNVTYRPKVARGAKEEDGEDDEPVTMADIAERSLQGLPQYR